MISLPHRIIREKFAFLIFLLAFLPWFSAQAAVDTQTGTFSFAHTGSVSTGLISIGGSFANTVTTPSPTITVPQFNPSLGKLTKVTVTVATSTSTFSVTPSGLLSLLTSQSATRRLSYSLVAGTSTGSNFNQVATSAGTLLTLLQAGGGELGGAPLSSATQFTSAADLTNFTGSGTFSASLSAADTFSVSTLVSAFNGAGMTGTGTYAGSVTATYEYTPWAISGYVYRDADHNGGKGTAEAGTGLTLYAKLLSSTNLAGPALRAVTVDPTTGLFSLPASLGSYRIVIDDNATLTDVTPLQPPAGWTAIQTGSLFRDVSIAGDTAGQDVGLIQATTVVGRLFVDDGKTSGVANDGIINGGEVGLSGRTISVLDANSVVLDSTTSGSDGSFRLFVPSTVPNGAGLRIRQGTDSLYLATGASMGNSGGSFSRLTNDLSLSFTSYMNYAGLNIGNVPVPTLGPDGTQAGGPMSVLFYSQKFVSGSTGQVAFSTSHVAPNGTPAWTDTIYLDSNNNGQVDAGEQPVGAPINVVAGQTVPLIVKVALPVNAPANAQLQTVLKADMSFTNAAPSLTYSATSVDYTNVYAANSAALSLTQTVDKSSAAPGSIVVYTITFTNNGSGVLSNVMVNDQTPPYTTFVSSSVVSIPGTLTTSATTAPAVGAKGALQWIFQGQLAPNASGTVRFSVAIEN